MSDPNIYTVGWICAIETELVAAASFLDEEHDDPDCLPVNDNNSYVLGRIGKHNVVIAALPNGQYGLVTAATVARDMVRSFSNIRIGLMVGIGGGAPSANHDIRLGDIVVSSPGPGSGGVFQYDYGKTIQDSEFVATSHLNQPPQFILAAIATLKAQYKRRGHDIEKTIADVLSNNWRLQQDYKKPDPSTDKLYISSYIHAGTKEEECTAICDTTQVSGRPGRSEMQDSPTIHYGTIASANQLMKDANLRNKLAAEQDVLCFEMEAAGLMNQFPCVVIRGICDYSDTHKNKVWQGYAAMVAAAYAKDLLRKVAPNKIEVERRIVDILSGVDSRLDLIDSQLRNTHSLIKSIRMDIHSGVIFQWLTPPDVSSNFNKAIQARHPGSGRGLLDSKAYTIWKTGDSSLLWLYGIPGCGKTILASTVIEDIQKSQSQNPPRKLLYFYFDFTDGRKQSFENTLRSLIWQMYQLNPLTQPRLSLLYTSAGQDGKEQPDCDSLQKAFIEMACDLKELWIVLDALDECTPRRKVLSWITNIAQGLSVQVKMHLLVTSRLEQDIQWAIERYGGDKQMIPIRGDLLEADIRDYVHARVHEHEGLSRWRGHKEIQNKIEASLLERVNGMFRWVSCQLDALEDCLERKTLLKALQSLPETLDETYERILANIPSMHAHHTKRILQFLTYSERPLRLEEMVDVIAVDVGHDVARGCRFDPQDRLPFPEEIARYCSSLIVLVSIQSEGGKEQTRTEIQLAHFSVKDYLASSRSKVEFSQCLQETNARSLIAEVCLVYLLELGQSKRTGRVNETFPFAQYSAQYWASHAIIGERHSDYVFELAKELLLSHSLLETWRRLYDPDRPWLDEPKADNIAPAVYYASILGLPRCVEMLLNDKADLTFRNNDGWTPLNAAADRGHLDVVRILLNNGADLTIANNDGWTPLNRAADRGHLKVVNIFLEKGANVNVPNNHNGWTPLNTAVFHQHYEIVNVLLQNGADGSIPDKNGLTPLHSASILGYTAIIELLLKNSANWTIVNQDGVTPLSLASYRGHTDIAKLLLENGDDLTVVNKDGWTSLFSASKKGHLEVVKLLLEKGADWTVANKDGWTPLNAAAHNGHLEIVKLLLEKGADWMVDSKGGLTPLYSASGKGHIDIVKMLLGHGADWTVANSNGWTPLNAASANGHAEVVKLLLKNGADWTVANKNGWTPLYSASSKGHTEVVRLLLEANADMAIVTKLGQSPIHGAALGGHSDVIHLLLRYGADMRILDIFGRPPFFYAIRSGDPTSFSVLKLPDFLEPGFRDVYGSNALSIAMRYGYAEIIRVLVAERSLMVEDCFGRTPIWWARKQGYMHMVEHIAVHPGPAESSNLPTGSPAKFHAEGGYCDVCLAILAKSRYYCKICCAGNFDICLDCYNVGARCLADDHHLDFVE